MTLRYGGVPLFCTESTGILGICYLTWQLNPSLLLLKVILLESGLGNKNKRLFLEDL